MLTKLSIANFAIIEQTEIEFSPNFNVITGETGAGKSILLGALSLILGNRADLAKRANADKKTVIEAFFTIDDKFQPYFAKNDLDFEQETIIRRELLPSGKSRAFVNDTPTSLTQLRELTNQLIDLHQQHDSLSVTKSDFQREVLDEFAGATSEVTTYHQQFLQWKKLKKQLQEKIDTQAEKQQQKDFLQFQFDELSEANLQAGELETIEKELNVLNHAEEIASSLKEVNQLLDGEDQSVSEILREAVSTLRKVSQLNISFEPLTNRLDSVFIELTDIIDELNATDTAGEIDEERLTFLTNRTDLLNRLLSKHQKADESELLSYFQEIEKELQSVESLSGDIDAMTAQIVEVEENLQAQAQVISAKRNDAKPHFEEKVKQLLERVGMPKATIELELIQGELTASGIDQIEFLFSANQGMSPKPMKQIASGGELSRLMLALKTITGGKSELATLVFDEIDTGISGEVAKKVGAVLQQLSENHQVIVITHSPQVAAKGTQHFKVYKQDVENKTKSTVKQLSKEERIQELAEMLSGANPSESSLLAAKELMG